MADIFRYINEKNMYLKNENKWQHLLTVKILKQLRKIVKFKEFMISVNIMTSVQFISGNVGIS